MNIRDFNDRINGWLNEPRSEPLQIQPIDEWERDNLPRMSEPPFDEHDLWCLGRCHVVGGVGSCAACVGVCPGGGVVSALLNQLQASVAQDQRKLARMIEAAANASDAHTMLVRAFGQDAASLGRVEAADHSARQALVNYLIVEQGVRASLAERIGAAL
jgi:hypothetical protein